MEARHGPLRPWLHRGLRAPPHPPCCRCVRLGARLRAAEPGGAMTEQRVAWPFARHLADNIIAELRYFCERVEVAGSVRRRRETVKDIEVLVIPKFGPRRLDMFGQELPPPPDFLSEY